MGNPDEKVDIMQPGFYRGGPAIVDLCRQTRSEAVMMRDTHYIRLHEFQATVSTQSEIVDAVAWARKMWVPRRAERPNHVFCLQLSEMTWTRLYEL